MDRRRFLLRAAALPALVALGETGRALDALAAPRGGKGVLALVTADLESHVVVLDLWSRSIVKRIPTGAGPRAIETVGVSTAIVAHSDHGAVTILGGGSIGVRAELDGFEQPRYVAAHPFHPLAYITDSHREEVVTLDVQRARILHRTPVGGPARHVSISADGRALWTALGGKAETIALLVLDDPRRPRFEHAFAPPFLAHDVVHSPDGRRVWVTSGSDRRLALYRSDGRRVDRILPAQGPPQHVAFRGATAFVASGSDGSVRRHAARGDPIDDTRVPYGSYNIATWRDGGISPSLSGGTLTILDRRGERRDVRRVARAAHDACVVSAA